jgi:hypothetical protein
MCSRSSGISVRIGGLRIRRNMRLCMSRSSIGGVVDGVLREMLGGGYGKWAEMPEGQEVLEGVVL